MTLFICLSFPKRTCLFWAVQLLLTKRFGLNLYILRDVMQHTLCNFVVLVLMNSNWMCYDLTSPETLVLGAWWIILIHLTSHKPHTFDEPQKCIIQRFYLSKQIHVWPTSTPVVNGRFKKKIKCFSLMTNMWEPLFTWIWNISSIVDCLF